MPNLVAATRFARPGRHLVLNGHIDVFPSGDPARWTHDPLSGAIVDGRVHGLGTVDMKCGTTASIFTYAYLSGLADELRGALTLTLVSDEETGGRWGSGYLVEHHADEVLGDCVLNGEPSSPHTIRFGEKAMFWMKFSIRTPAGTARIRTSARAPTGSRPRSSATSSRWNRSCPPLPRRSRARSVAATFARAPSEAWARAPRRSSRR
jgi:succinyl-diaminopimelate desuccinylase